ncbi:GNAT family N-acetyltransferase [Microbacterium sp. ANT_H45B]|uniref:GNAT family N-acetyltransferase n=1 Tax=Microbacterium TaxID=33882 RepID=UPI0011EE0ED3|nr:MULTISPECIES: GNAT family N-acetyltransferase [Microbacterium]KAA0960010.1 GNAT family N-acetyltransferase [Microbacterium sp. ANT_H45B]
MSGRIDGMRRDAGIGVPGAEMELRMLHLPSEMVAATELVAGVWNVDVERAHVNAGLLTALAHAGNYVAGGYRGDELMAVCVGFFHPPFDRALHSHLAGVRLDAIGQGWGHAIKSHQREWCLGRGVTRVTWTFDPLVARNAYFNLHKLGCRIDSYLLDFYGELGDGVNGGQRSDRALVVWDLERPVGPRSSVAADAEMPPAILWEDDGQPVLDLDRARGLQFCRIDIPSDIEKMRRVAPELAVRWRVALGHALGGLLAEGWDVSDFDRRGHYTLTRSS